MKKVISIKKVCKQCGKPLDCHSVCRCSVCLFKERIYDERRRYGWNPSCPNENIQINDSPFKGEIKELIKEDENN